MTTTHTLAEQIDRVIRGHVAALHAIAAEAVAQAFATAGSEPLRGKRAAHAGAAAKAKRRPAPRRAPEELAALAEQLDAVVRATPGETMAILAAQVGTSPRDLKVAAARLKRAGRVRGAGQRQYTRYFPMTRDTPAAT